MRSTLFILIGVSSLLMGCLPEPEAAIDEATVLGDNTSVRIDATSAARTMFTLDRGERVSILEKRGTWYRIRDREQIEGWMDESTVLTDRTLESMRAELARSASQQVQNTARAREQVNLRVNPGRDTAIVRRLRRGTVLEVLDRSTTARPDSDETDIWFKVRPSEDEIGWVYSRLIEFDTPAALAGFTEGRTYVAVQELRQVEDPEAGVATWYVVAERRADTEVDVAYDGIRVFVWNLPEHQYETTLRLRNLRGLYPLELTGDAESPGFRFHMEGSGGQPVARDFVMRQTLPREVTN